MATSGPDTDTNRAKVSAGDAYARRRSPGYELACFDCHQTDRHAIDCPLNVERTPATLEAALATALHSIHIHVNTASAKGARHVACGYGYVDHVSDCATFANAILAHPVMQAWLRANDAALVALLIATKVKPVAGERWLGRDAAIDKAIADHASVFVEAQERHAIAAARERLR